MSRESKGEQDERNQSREEGWKGLNIRSLGN